MSSPTVVGEAPADQINTNDDGVVDDNDGGSWVVDGAGADELHQATQAAADMTSCDDDDGGGAPNADVATCPTPEGMHRSMMEESPPPPSLPTNNTTANYDHPTTTTISEPKEEDAAPTTTSPPSPPPPATTTSSSVHISSVVSSPRRKQPHHHITNNVVVVSAAGSVPPKGGRQLVPMPPPPVVYESHTTLGSRSDRSLKGNKLSIKTTCTNSPRNFPRGQQGGINGPAQVRYPYDPVANCKAARLANIKRCGRTCNAELVVQSSEPAVTMFTIRRPELSDGHIDQLDWTSSSSTNVGGSGHPSSTSPNPTQQQSHRPRSTAEQIAVLGQDSTVTGTVLRMRHLPVPPPAMTQARQTVDLMCPRAQFPNEPKRFFVAVPDRRHIAGRGSRQAPDHRARYYDLLQGGITTDAAAPAYVMAVEDYDKAFMMRQLRGKDDADLQASLKSPLAPLITSSNNNKAGGGGSGRKKVEVGILEVVGASSSSYSRHQHGSGSSSPTGEDMVAILNGTVSDGRPPISGRMRVEEERRLLTSSQYTSSLARRHSLDNLIRNSQLARNAHMGIKGAQVPACPSFLSPLSSKPPQPVSSRSTSGCTGGGALIHTTNNNNVLGVVNTTPGSRGGGGLVDEDRGPMERLRDRMALEDDTDEIVINTRPLEITSHTTTNGDIPTTQPPRLSKRKESARRRYEEHQGLLLAAALPEIM